jgi:hypothetical protein
MFKTLFTLVRGATAAAEGEVVAHNAAPAKSASQIRERPLMEIDRAK